MLYAKKKVKKGSKALTVILWILIIILAAAAVFSWLIFNGSGDTWKKQASMPSAALGETVIKSAMSGKEQPFSASEADGYVNYLLQRHRSGILAKTDYAALRLKGDGTADIYIPVNYKGKILGVTMNFIPSCDSSRNRLVFKIKSFYVGRLPVKPSWALKIIKSKMPSALAAENDTVYYDMPRIKVALGAVSAEARINELKAEAAFFKIRANTSIGLSVSG